MVISSCHCERSVAISLRVNTQFRQIFLITHHEDLKDAMRHVMIVEEVEEGMSLAVFASS